MNININTFNFYFETSHLLSCRAEWVVSGMECVCVGGGGGGVNFCDLMGGWG